MEKKIKFKKSKSRFFIRRYLQLTIAQVVISFMVYCIWYLACAFYYMRFGEFIDNIIGYSDTAHATRLFFLTWWLFFSFTVLPLADIAANHDYNNQK